MKTKQRVLIMLMILLFCYSTTLFTQPQWIGYTTDDYLSDIEFQGEYVWYSYRGGLSIIHTPTGEVMNYNSANSGLPDNHMREVKIASDGTPWVLGRWALSKYVNDEFIIVNNILDEDKILRYTGIVDFDSQGNLVMSASYKQGANTKELLVKIDDEENITQITSDIPNFAFNNIKLQTLMMDHEDNVWGVTYSNSVVVFDSQGNKTVFDAVNSSLEQLTTTHNVLLRPDNNITVIQYKVDPDIVLVHTYDGQNWGVAEIEEWEENTFSTLILFHSFYDAQGNLWISGDNEYCIKYNEEEVAYFEWPLASSYSNYTILANIDEQGGWWIHSDFELGSRLYRYYEGATTFFDVATPELVSNEIVDIHIDDNNKVWALSFQDNGLIFDTGIAVFDGQDWTFHTTELNPNFLTICKNIRTDLEGNIWMSLGHIGGEPYGFAKRSEDGWEYFDLGQSSALSSIYGEEFFFDNEGVLWAAISTGIARYDGEEWMIFDESNAGVSEFMRYIEPAGENTFYYAGYKHLAYYDGNSFIELEPATSLSEQGFITDLYVDHSGVLWIIYYSSIDPYNGILIYDGNNFTDITNQLPPEAVHRTFEIAQTSDGTYWFATSNGLVKYDQESWEVIKESQVFNNYQGIAVDSFDNIWLTHDDRGISVYNENGINNTGTSVISPQTAEHPCGIIFTPNPVSSDAIALIPEPYIGGDFALYNAAGDRVKTVTGLKEQFTFSRKTLPAGLYFYRLERGSYICSGKLILK